ncbi:unnamed protein product, partial [Ectocarpus sp. 13 AM-2016]
FSQKRAKSTTHIEKQQEHLHLMSGETEGTFHERDVQQCLTASKERGDHSWQSTKLRAQIMPGNYVCSASLTKSEQADLPQDNNAICCPYLPLELSSPILEPRQRLPTTAAAAASV